jgi:polysaccharide pyruvyl transferase WcaK-like protein
LEKTVKIGLLDHMGYGNLGDAATQDALIANIKLRLPEVQLVGFSLNPVDTEKRHSIPSYSITNWHPGLDRQPTGADNSTSKSNAQQLKSFLKQIPVLSSPLRWLQNLMREFQHLGRSYRCVRALDCLVIAGGGQLSELWRGPWSHPYNVFKFSVLAKLARRRLLVVNVGAGPIKSRLGKAFIRASVRIADYVSLRDVESQELVQDLGIRRETYVFPDSAYALDMTPYTEANTSRERKQVVGINPIGFCDPRIWPRQDAALYSRYLDGLAQFSLWLLSKGYDPKIFSAERSVDIYAIEDLKDRLRAGLPAEAIDRICSPRLETVEDLLTEMAGFDFVVTSKFHGVVFSHLLARPMVAISYHRKIDDLMRTVGDSRYCLNIESFDSDLLIRTFAELAENTSTLKAKYRQIVATRAGSLNLQFDDIFAPEHFGHDHGGMRSVIAGKIDSGPEWPSPPSALEERNQ